MNKLDIINASFELVGYVLQLLNIRKLYIHKQLKGVHWSSTAFFVLWGAWNVFMFPALGFWLSFGVGILLLLANLIWVVMSFYYQSKYFGRSKPSSREIHETRM